MTEYEWLPAPASSKARYERCLASLNGVNKQIARRESLMRQLRSWYLNPNKGSTSSFTMLGFYRCGIKAMRELSKLKLIRDDLRKILYNMIERKRIVEDVHFKKR